MALVDRGVLLFEARGYGVHFRLCCAYRNAGFQAAGHGELMAGAVQFVPRPPQQRHEQLHVVYGIFKTRGKDADDLRGVPVDGESAAKQSSVGAEAPLPETVCQDYGAVATLNFLLLSKTGTERRRNADNIEELRRDNARQYPFRARIALPRDSGVGYSGHVLKAGALIAPVQEIRR